MQSWCTATLGDLNGIQATGVEQLRAHGWPATFIVMFDEAWSLVQRMSEVRSSVSAAHEHQVMHETTGNRVNMDIVAWHVDASKGVQSIAGA